MGIFLLLGVRIGVDALSWSWVAVGVRFPGDAWCICGKLDTIRHVNKKRSKLISTSKEITPAFEKRADCSGNGCETRGGCRFGGSLICDVNVLAYLYS